MARTLVKELEYHNANKAPKEQAKPLLQPLPDYYFPFKWECPKCGSKGVADKGQAKSWSNPDLTKQRRIACGTCGTMVEFH